MKSSSKKSSSKKKKSKDRGDEEEEDDDDGVGHCRQAPTSSGQILEFFRLYVLDWRTLAAVAVPTVFCVLFPAFWLLACPSIWAAYPEVHRPKIWLAAYWIFAALVWCIFLVICFYRSRSEGVPPLSGCGSKTESTEDLWSEDHYLPENYLPSPDYVVSAVQPKGAGGGGDSGDDVDDSRRHLDDWDYDYDRDDFGGGCGRPANGGRFPFEEQYHSLSALPTLPPWKQHPVPAARKFSAPVFSGVVRGGTGGGGAYLRTPDGGSTEEEAEGGYLRGSHHRMSGGRRKVLTRTRPRYHPSPPVMPRLPWPTDGRCALRRQRGVRAPLQRHLRPVRCGGHPRMASRGDDGVNSGQSSLASSVSDLEPLSESTPPSMRRSRHVPPPPLRRLNLITTGRPHTPPPALLRRPTPPARFLVRRPPAASDGESAAESRRRLHDSMTEEELRSLRDVAAGRVRRKDSLVSDAKFDSLLTSLQSLASELERDFTEGGEMSQGEEDRQLLLMQGEQVSPRRKNSQESATDASSLSNANY